MINIVTTYFSIPLMKPLLINFHVFFSDYFHVKIARGFLVFINHQMKMPMKKSLPYGESSDESDATSPKEKRAKLDKCGDDYLARRERNNIAVRKSREKSRAKAKETMAQVDRLRKENEMLEQKVTILSKELSVLKDLFLAHAGNVGDRNCPSPPPTTITVQVTASPQDHQYSAKNPSN